MADHPQQPGPGDVADEKGRFVAEGLPGEPPMIPGGGYGDSRGVGAGATSGSHIDDDTKGPPQAPDATAERSAR